MERYVCLHGHFYQPPRENAWLEEVELQDSAYPYHDWNERITAECYAPNTASRILDSSNKIIDIVNNFSMISFNVGPTLLSWMERHKPEVYAGMLEADRLSMERFSGHGSAIAQVYNHMIMPLANRRDKYTQALWGVRDFERRFGRAPEGMWLSETAVDIETLEVLAELNIKYTILAPRQARRTKQHAKGARWHEVKDASIDPTTAYQCSLPSGRTIALFFYDGPISQDIAFGGLLNNGEAFAQRLTEAFKDERPWPQIVHIATDGESYGHHHRNGDMALAYCLHHIASHNAAVLTNYGEYLAKHPPTHSVEIIENSSWSCIHGIERWKSNCGCNSGGKPGWTQEWRGPLRDAMDQLRDGLAPMFEEEGRKYLNDPWRARNEYIGVLLDRSKQNINGFLSTHASRELSHEETIRVLKLLELQRNAMLMYTSCGWFFDEISGIETTQVLQYTSKVIQLGEEVFNIPLEANFVSRMEGTPSNVLENGARVYEAYVKPAQLDMLRVAAHYGISSLFEEKRRDIALYCYKVDSDDYKYLEAGRFKLAIGRIIVTSELTWQKMLISFAVIHFGDHNVNGGVREFMGDDAYTSMQNDIAAAFEKGNVPEVMKLMDRHFGTNSYSIWHLFKDEQRKVLRQILKTAMDEVDASFHRIYEDNYGIMTTLQNLRNPIPPAFMFAAEYVVNSDLKLLLEDGKLDTTKLGSLIKQVKKWSFKLDTELVQYVATRWVNSAMEEVRRTPEDIGPIRKLAETLQLLDILQLELDLWKAQNTYFSIGKSHYFDAKKRAEDGDEPTKEWIGEFTTLGSRLHVKVE